MIRYTAILILFFEIVTGQQCDQGCYEDVPNRLENLRALYRKSPPVSNLEPNFDNIRTLINKTENIALNIKYPEETNNKSLSSYEAINNSSKKLELLKKLISQIDTINNRLDELNGKKEKHIEAVNECDEADKLYKQLRDDVEEITQTGNNITKAFGEKPKCVDEVKKQSLDIKKDLDQTAIPDILFGTYLCNSKLQITIQDIINIAREIENNLKSLFGEIINLKLDELKNNITEHERGIEEMQNALSERLPEADLKVTDETKIILEDLKEQVNDLKNKIKEIKLDKTFEDILGKAKEKMNELINEYGKILNHIFSTETKDKVKEEIKKAKETLRLLKERNAIKAELDDIKKIVNLLQDRGVCFVNEKVSVEDRI